ncbi:hypothetical protein VPH35_016454 [Triticum aestivum]
MYRVEEKLRGHALVGTVEGHRPPVSLAQVVAALESQCSLFRDHIMVELTAGGATIQFSRWHRGMGDEASSLKFLTRLSLDGLSQEAWEVEFVGKLVSSIGGDLVKMVKPTDRCFVVVEAWMKNPSKVPKLYEVELPEPDLPEDYPTSDSDGPISPPSSHLTLEKPTVLHVVKIHILKVIDRSPILTELPPAYDYDDESNSARCHTFSCYPGTIDGTERAYIGGGHGFAGPGTDGRAGGMFKM